MKVILSLLLLAAPLLARPNVVLLLIDDLGRQDIGVHGSTFHDTPNIDRLGKEGLVFENAYCAHPRCVPSRYGIFSGRLPARDGVPGFEGRKHTLAPERVTFAEVMRDAGYVTGYIGKWHLGKEGGGPDTQGFSDSRIAGAAGGPNSYFYPFHLTPDGKHKENEVFPVVDGKEGEYLNDRLTDEAVDFLKENRERPFLLVLAHYAVHTPFQAPEGMVDQARKRLNGDPEGGKWKDPDFKDSDGATDKTVQNNPVYAAMVKSMDDSVGRVLDTLEELELSGNTLVLMTSDHGGLSTRGGSSGRPLATTNLPYRHGKGWLYDGGLRVPMIVKWPGVVKPGTTKAATLGTDHYATVLEAVGLKADPGEAVDSVSYLPLLKGESMERGPMFFHSPRGRPQSTGDRNASAVIDGRWKLFQNHGSGQLELYDLAADPGEAKDLSETYPERAAEMRKLLNDLKQQTGAKEGGRNPFDSDSKSK
ncbi:sulfatase [Haloferula helveola]|uniref:Sulfatase n=1 Tax=Haloferula helveola TaxID=490095 RepID=A0ABM7RJR6_9BACT|nr:sulfatase [Haloferula helveola]